MAADTCSDQMSSSWITAIIISITWISAWLGKKPDVMMGEDRGVYCCQHTAKRGEWKIKTSEKLWECGAVCRTSQNAMFVL